MGRIQQSSPDAVCVWYREELTPVLPLRRAQACRGDWDKRQWWCGGRGDVPGIVGLGWEWILGTLTVQMEKQRFEGDFPKVTHKGGKQDRVLLTTCLPPEEADCSETPVLPAEECRPCWVDGDAWLPHPTVWSRGPLVIVSLFNEALWYCRKSLTIWSLWRETSWW